MVEFEGIYRPIVGSSEPGNDIEYAETPEAIVQRTAHLKEVYEELKNTVLDEVNMVDNNLVRPAMDARDSIQPIKKVIKKREDKKVRDCHDHLRGCVCSSAESLISSCTRAEWTIQRRR